MPPFEQSVELGAAFATMDERLVEYGLCWIRGGKSDSGDQIVKMRDEVTKEVYEVLMSRRREWESDHGMTPREWSEPDKQKAGRLHSLIIRLPLQHSMVLQVFYGEWVAEVWGKLPPNIQAAAIRDMTNWRGKPKGVNARIADANRARGTDVPGIYPGRFLPLRDDGIRMLINLDRRLRGAQHPASFPPHGHKIL